MRLRPTRAVRVSAVMCALTLTALSPFPLSPPAGADESAAPAAPADSPAAGATTIDLLGITDLAGQINPVSCRFGTHAGVAGQLIQNRRQ